MTVIKIIGSSAVKSLLKAAGFIIMAVNQCDFDNPDLHEIQRNERPTTSRLSPGSHKTMVTKHCLSPGLTQEQKALKHVKSDKIGKPAAYVTVKLSHGLGVPIKPSKFTLHSVRGTDLGKANKNLQKTPSRRKTTLSNCGSPVDNDCLTSYTPILTIKKKTLTKNSLNPLMKNNKSKSTIDDSTTEDPKYKHATGVRPHTQTSIDTYTCTPSCQFKLGTKISNGSFKTKSDELSTNNAKTSQLSIKSGFDIKIKRTTLRRDRVHKSRM